MQSSCPHSTNIFAIFLSTLLLLGLPAPHANAGTYLNSAHGGAGVPGNGALRTTLPGTIAAGNCSHCHETHASIGGSEPVPVKPGPSDYLLFDDLAGNAMCYHCHDLSTQNNADDIETQINKSHSHDPNSATPVLCTDCHDSHVAGISTRTGLNAVGNTVSEPLLSEAGATVVPGVSASWNDPNSPPPAAGNENIVNATLTSLAPISAYTLEYQLCLNCHGGQPAFGQADLSGQFNPGNYALHPVVQTSALQWNNSFLRANPSALQPPWDSNVNALMFCSDCHGSENSTDPNGPHGSSNIYMLKQAGPGATLDNLCLGCHDDPSGVGASSWTDIWGTVLVGDHSLAAHKYPTNARGCLGCHGDIGGALTSNIHGANYVGNDNGIDTGRPSYAFLFSSLITRNYYSGADPFLPGTRTCATVVGCHTGGAAYTY